MNQVSSKSLAINVLAGVMAALIAGGAAGIALSQTAAAQQAETSGASVQLGAQDAQSARRLSMGVGKSLILDLPRDAAEVVVGNPKIANAIVRSPRRIFVLGVDNGATTIFAMDKDGNKIASVEISIGRDINELRAILKTAMPSSNIEVKTVNDTIILTGSVDSAAEAQKAADIADAFVGYTAVGGGGSPGAGGVSFSSSTVITGKVINSITIRGRDQVMLKVTIAEVRRSVMKAFGVSLAGSWGTLGGGAAGSVFPGGGAPVIATQNDYGFNDSRLSFGGKSGSIGGIVTALERQGVARVLAEPTVTAISGEAAKFTAGGEIQVLKQFDCTGGSTFFTRGGCKDTYELKPYGITLNFTPTVLSEGRIQLHLATEVSEIDHLNGNTSAVANLPAFRTRRHETTLELPSGGSIVSAGLIQQKSRAIIQGQPGLMNLPVLGALFRSRDFQSEETELMIIVTPYITKTLRADQISRPDDGFANASDPQGYFLGKVNRIYSRASNPQILNTYKGRVGFIQD